MMRTLTSIIVATILLASPARADGLATVLEVAIEKHGVPAAAAITIRGDIIVETGVAGVRKTGTDDHAGADDLWHLGSCTKAMTATLAARLVERGVMRWDMTIAEVFADDRDAMRAEYHDVTLEQLVTNRGRVAGDIVGTAAWRHAWEQKGTVVEQRHRLMLDVLAMKSPVAPGGYLYANAGFAIAGHMCERVTGTPWEDLMRRDVFGPLGMTSAGFGAPASREGEHPIGHKSDGTAARPTADNPPAISPAGRVHCRLADWAKFVGAHLLGAQGKGDDAFLSAASFARLHTPAAGPEGDPGPSYAMGWGVKRRGWGGDGPVLTHSGSNTMWFCTTWLAPDKNVAVLVACNQGGAAARSACDELSGALLRRVLDAPGGSE